MLDLHGTARMESLHKSQPIGIFDSGIGGLTVASAIAHLLPNERLIYFGDTAHLPYGDKSTESIRKYSMAIAKFLESRSCKVILIACNTASALAYPLLSKTYGRRLMVIDVINPVARYVASHHRGEKIGVIATKGTVLSRSYPRRIKKLNPQAVVTTLATPLLAPMIEEHFFNNNISRTVVASYLSKKSLSDLKALILGCTHYPLIRREVEHYYREKVSVIDSATCVANYLKRALSECALLNDRASGQHEFFVSDYTESFARSAKMFFGDNVELKSSSLWAAVDTHPNI
jgi:glutamate racemase